MSIYRNIYKKHHGVIPKDATGRAYDIHHLDGNHKNNDISNLKAVSKEDHFNIHYIQGDWRACWLLAISLKLSPEEISILAKKNHLRRIENKTHPFLGGDIARETSQRRVREKTHNFLGGQIQRETAQRRVSNGTHHWLSGELQRASTQRRLKNGSHPFKEEWTCEHCGVSGKNKAMYNRWHNTNCKLAG